MTCVACRRGFPEECSEPGGPCAAPVAAPPDLEDEDAPEDGGRVVNTYKRDSKLKDQQSTGRKRAAIMYPLDREANCEWQGLKLVGGGVTPINGCPSGLQEARHHGPDKNTLMNETGNVHRICHQCHNRWHTENDANYIWTAVHAPHSPVGVMTPAEIVENEIYWANRGKLKRAID